ncbi:MAG: PDZ domain-containing protein [Phycisphaerales bacterium]|nr:PDZ domain-containing protein [Phycisphaerales bacterium]
MTLTKTLLLPLLLLVAGVAPGWLGVFLGESDDGLPSVLEVVAGSPAEKAGVLAGDVLLAIDGQALATTEAVVAEVGAREAGTKIKLTVRRDGAKKVIEVTLGKKAPDPEAGRVRVEEEGAEADRRAQAEKARADAEKARKAAEVARAAAEKAAEKAEAQRARDEKARLEKEKAKERAAAKDAAKKEEAAKKETAHKEAKEKSEHGEAHDAPRRGGRPFLGVALDATDAGVRIGEVLADSPAAAAGIASGGTLVAIGDAAIKTLADVDAAMGRLRAGQKIGIRVRAAGGEARSHDVVLGRAPGAGTESGEGREHEVVAREQKPARRTGVTDRAVAARATDAALQSDARGALRAARGKQPVLLVFGASWDSGTKALRRSLAEESVRKALSDVSVVWVDTDREGRVADEFGVQQIPHMVAIDPQGKKVGTVEGYQPPEVLLEKFAELRAKATRAATGGRSEAKADAKPAAKPAAASQAKADRKPQGGNVVVRPLSDKPATDKKPAASGERDLETEVRALRDEIRELRQVLRELLKEKEKRG